jgi:hypothetical protein
VELQYPASGEGLNCPSYFCKTPKPELGVWIVAFVEVDAVASGNESDGLFSDRSMRGWGDR